MSKPILVDGWNPFHHDARYGTAATLGLLVVGYVVIANVVKRHQAASAAGLGAYYQDPVVQPIHGLGSNYVSTNAWSKC